MIDGSDRLSATKRAELRGVISTKPGLARFLRTTAGGIRSGVRTSPSEPSEAFPSSWRGWARTCRTLSR